MKTSLVANRTLSGQTDLMKGSKTLERSLQKLSTGKRMIMTAGYAVALSYASKLKYPIHSSYCDPSLSHSLKKDAAKSLILNKVLAFSNASNSPVGTNSIVELSRLDGHTRFAFQVFQTNTNNRQRAISFSQRFFLRAKDFTAFAFKDLHTSPGWVLSVICVKSLKQNKKGSAGNQVVDRRSVLGSLPIKEKLLSSLILLTTQGGIS